MPHEAPLNTSSILLVSPREPSGGSWLVNCLLELGVRVNLKPAVDRAWRNLYSHRDPSDMWVAAPDGRWRLHPRTEELKKWLPILERQETLAFREDVEALYVQDLPRPEFSCDRVVLFLRDPRDAIHSLYRRIRPDMSLEEFLRFPHPETLLDAVGHWALFVKSWLGREHVYVYRFEDYKADATGLLTRNADDLGLEVPLEEITRAAAESSYEKARAAEERYRAEHPWDEEVAMRAGQVGEWINTREMRDLSTEIENRVGRVLTRLGYLVQADSGTERWREGVSQLSFLSVFERLDLPLDLRDQAAAANPLLCPQLPAILSFASMIDGQLIRRARLESGEARALLDSLQEFVSAWQDHQSRRAAAVRSEFEEGADYHLTRIRDLVSRRRVTRSTAPGQDHDELLSST